MPAVYGSRARVVRGEEECRGVETSEPVGIARADKKDMLAIERKEIRQLPVASLPD